MKIKNFLILFIAIFLILNVFINLSCVAVDADISQVISGMKDVKKGTSSTGKIGGVINNVIFLIQVAGTGIALIVITMLGIKYIIASVEEKAEIKKQAVPILIGCILLFGAVNIISAISSFTQSALS